MIDENHYFDWLTCPHFKYFFYGSGGFNGCVNLSNCGFEHQWGLFPIRVLAVVLNGLVSSRMKHWVDLRWLVDLIWQLFFLTDFILAG